MFFKTIMMGKRGAKKSAPSDLTPDQKPKSKEKPVGAVVTYPSIKFNSIYTGIEHEGVIVSSVIHHKAKSDATRLVYIVSIYMVDGRFVTPYLKWINKSYCEPVTTERNLSKIDIKYFNYDWMMYEETKRIKRVRSTLSLQKEDVGEIWDGYI